MSKFLTPLQVEEVSDGSSDGRGTWRLLATLVYESDLLKRRLTVPVGMLTDFASVPRIPIAFLLAGGAGNRAAVIHDWLYSTHEVERSVADAVFREALLAGGEPVWRAWMMYAGVRIGGSGPYEANGQPQPEHVAVFMNAEMQAP
jgi:hypothetical protein